MDKLMKYWAYFTYFIVICASTYGGFSMFAFNNPPELPEFSIYNLKWGLMGLSMPLSLILFSTFISRVFSVKYILVTLMTFVATIMMLSGTASFLAFKIKRLFPYISMDMIVLIILSIFAILILYSLYYMRKPLSNHS